MSCLAQLSRQKRILRTKVPGSIQTFLLRCQPLSKRFLFSGHCPVARDACSCFFFLMIPSMPLVFVWARSMLARTYRLDSWQQLLLKVLPRLRFTVQHVYSHAECADHAAALGALASCRTITFPHAAYPSFDSNLCFAICHNLGDVLENYVTLEQTCISFPAPDQELELGSTLCDLRVPRSSWLFLVHSLGSIFYSLHYWIFFLQWNSQTLRLFLPRRALSTLLSITFGIHFLPFFRADWRHFRNLHGWKLPSENRTFLSFCPFFTMWQGGHSWSCITHCWAPSPFEKFFF